MDTANIQINPQTVINELQNRLNALQGENVVLAAMVTELRATLEDVTEEEAEDGES
jgi:prefoldin subunit 5